MAFLRYSLVGLTNTGVSVAVMAALAFLGVHYLVYTAVALVAALVNSYLLNARFTFRTRTSLKAFVKFSVVNAALLVPVEILQYVLIDVIGLREVVGVGIGMVVFT